MSDRLFTPRFFIMFAYSVAVYVSLFQLLPAAPYRVLSLGGTTAAALKTDYYSAYTALVGFKDDKGMPLAPSEFRPLIWAPNSAALIQQFEDLRGAPLISNSTNILANRFDLVIDPRLTDANDWYMFRTDGAMRPFIVVNREEPHYRDNFASMADDVFKRRKGMASVEARLAATYGLWQKAVQVVN